MADLHIDWMKPIELPRVGKHSISFETDDVPKEPGVYLFFRRVGKNTTQVIYVGKAENLKIRTKGHRKNHDIIKSLLEKRGTYYLMAGVFKPLPGQTVETSIETIERVLIRACIEDGHPLINVKGVRIRTRHVRSTLPVGGKFLREEIAFEPPAKKRSSAKKK